MALLRSPDEEKSVIHIVGQGLAGSTLALRLYDMGFRVRIYDNGYKTSSSRVAAGMWNPLSFVNLKSSWMANQLMPEMEVTYRRMERLLGVSFFHPMPLLRVFPNAGATNLWEEKSRHPEVEQYIDSNWQPDLANHYETPFGSGVVKGAGWLNIPVYLSATRAFFESIQAFDEREIGEVELTSWLEHGDIVLQCTGWKPMQRSFWHEVPIHTNKGQVLTLKMEEMSSDFMSNFGKFLIPMGNDLFRAGSTYEHGALDSLPSDVANEILDDVSRSVKCSYSLVDHTAGFRPTTIDRQPVIGMHSQHPRLGLFNGFGSRGVMLVPFFVNHLIDHLMNETPIMREVHWKRFEERRLRRL
jgi:glycine/D-amino acid oxidase-like deaminating enzyme